MSDVDVIIQVHTQGVKNINDLSASLRNLRNSINGINVPMSKLDVNSKAVYKALGITSRGVNDHAKSIKALVQNQKVLGQESKRITADLRNLKNAYVLAGKETTDLGRKIGQTTKDLEAFSRTFRGMRLRALGSDFSNISLKLTKLGKDAQFVGRSLLINLTLPLATFARTGLQAFLAIDTQIVRLTKVLEDVAPTIEIAAQKMGQFNYETGQAAFVSKEAAARAEKMVSEFQRLDRAITDLSVKFGVSKDLVTSLSADFAELGLTSQDNITKLSQLTLEIEKLGNMDIGPAQDLSQALYFQSKRALEVNEALARLTSARQRETAAIKAATGQLYLFNAIENVTALTLRDLGDAFPEVASTAVSFGLSMTEAAALLAPMKAAGLDVGASANSIKVSLQRLIAPTKQNVDMLQKLAKEFGVAEDKQNDFMLSTKTGLVGLEATVKLFDAVKNSAKGNEGALRVMSELFEKRQGPRMYLAIEQLSNFNKELQKTELFAGQSITSSQSAEVQLVKTAESAASGFKNFNTTIVPKTIRSFRDIGNVARIATAVAGQKIEIEPGKTQLITGADIANAKAMRDAVAKFVKDKKQAEGIDIISEVKSEAGRALMIELAGGANAALTAQQELERSLASTQSAVDRIKNTFKLFAADIIRSLVPAIEKLAKKVTEMYQKWNSPEFADTRQKIIDFIITFGGFLTMLGPTILALGTFNSVVGNVGRGMSILFPKLKNVNGEFIGIGKSAKLAADGINSMYTTFLDKARAVGSRAVGGMPGIASPIGLPSRPKAAPVGSGAARRMLDDALRAEIAATGATPAQIAEARREFAAGTRTGGIPVGRRTKSAILGPRGGRRTISASVVDIIRLLEGREIADLTPSRGRFTSPSTGRFVSASGPEAEAGRRISEKLRRRRDIFAINPYLQEAGIETDRMGTKFIRRGREITEGQARNLARGGLFGVRARAGIAIERGLKPARAIAGSATITSARAAMATAPSSLHALVAGTAAGARGAVTDIGRLKPFRAAAAAKTAFTGAAAGTGIWQKLGIGATGYFAQLKGGQAAIDALIAKHSALGLKSPSTFKQLGAAIMGYIKSIKIATGVTKIFRVAMMMTGVGAIIAGIAAVVYLVIKNMDKIKGAKKGWDALKQAFDIFKSALMEIVRPIQDLFAMFGSGGDQGEAAGNAIASAFEGIAAAVKWLAGIFKMLVEKVIQPYLYGIVNVVMAVVSLFKGNWGDALQFLIAAVASVVKGIIGLWSSLGIGLVKIIVAAISKVLDVFGKIPFVGKLFRMAKTAVQGIGNLAASGMKKVSDTITGALDKATALGVKKSTNQVNAGKDKMAGAGHSAGEAYMEAITNAMGNDDSLDEATDKVAGKLKEGIMDAAQKLQDFVRDRFGNALKKFISDTAAALNKQKDSALKVFDIQINTLMKLEKAEESLTKKKEYETNRRKLIDDATLRRQQYLRNRALAIYEGRIDEARLMDVEEQVAAGESQSEISALDESRRKELAKENLDALREAINQAKELAGKFFDESIEKFKLAAEKITEIGPVTIEQYTAQLNDLKALSTQYADENNVEFGKMFEKFSTTIAEKMPNTVDEFGKALGAFATPLDELVRLAESKYGLGSEDEATVLGVTKKMSNAVIGVTLGMLVDIGDTFTSSAPDIVEKYGEVTGGLVGETGTFKEEVLGIFAALLNETKTAFLDPYKKAFDEADPTSVYREAIRLGNLQIQRDFENTLEYNKELFEKMRGELDKTTLKWIALKAAIDAANDAASGGSGSAPSTPSALNLAGYGSVDRLQDYLLRTGIEKPSDVNAALFRKLGMFGFAPDGRSRVGSPSIAARPVLVKGRAGSPSISTPVLGSDDYITRKTGGPIPLAGMPLAPYGLSGFLNAPTSQAIPAILHGGEFVVNADAVKRIGLGALSKLNDPRIPKFKKGGLVGASAEERRQMAMKPQAKATLGYTADRMEKLIGKQVPTGPVDRIERQVKQQRDVVGEYLKSISTPQVVIQQKDRRSLIEKGLDVTGGFLKAAGVSIGSTATRVGMTGYNIAASVSSDIVKGKLNVLKNLQDRQNDLYYGRGVTLFGQQLAKPGDANYLKNLWSDKSLPWWKKALGSMSDPVIEDIMNVLPVGAFGVIGKGATKVATSAVKGGLANAMITSGSPTLTAAGAQLIKTSLTGGAKFATNAAIMREFASTNEVARKIVETATGRSHLQTQFDDAIGRYFIGGQEGFYNRLAEARGITSMEATRDIGVSLQNFKQLLGIETYNKKGSAGYDLVEEYARDVIDSVNTVRTQQLRTSSIPGRAIDKTLQVAAKTVERFGLVPQGYADNFGEVLGRTSWTETKQRGWGKTILDADNKAVRSAREEAKQAFIKSVYNKYGSASIFGIPRDEFLDMPFQTRQEMWKAGPMTDFYNWMLKFRQNSIERYGVHISGNPIIDSLITPRSARGGMFGPAEDSLEGMTYAWINGNLGLIERDLQYWLYRVLDSKMETLYGPGEFVGGQLLPNNFRSGGLEGSGYENLINTFSYIVERIGKVSIDPNFPTSTSAYANQFRIVAALPENASLDEIMQALATVRGQQMPSFVERTGFFNILQSKINRAAQLRNNVRRIGGGADPYQHMLEILNLNPRALGMGDTTGRFLPIRTDRAYLEDAFFLNALKNPTEYISEIIRGVDMGTGLFGVEFRDDIGYKVLGHIFSKLPGVIDQPVGFGFNISKPYEAFPDLPRNTDLVHANPFAIRDFARGRGLIDKMYPSEFEAAGLSFAQDFLHAQHANSVLEQLKGRLIEAKQSAMKGFGPETWAYREDELMNKGLVAAMGINPEDYATPELFKEAFFTARYNQGIKNIYDGIFNEYGGGRNNQYQAVLDSLNIKSLEDLIKFDPYSIEILSPSQIDFIALAALRGQSEAQFMFRYLTKIGNSIKESVLEQNKAWALRRAAGQELISSANMDNSFFVRETNANFPSEEVIHGGLRRLQLRSAGQRNTFGSDLISRNTIHGAINHIVGAHFYRGAEDMARYYIAALSTIEKYNPGSIASLYGIDSYLVPPAHGSISIPEFDLTGKQNYWIFDEKFEFGPERNEDLMNQYKEAIMNFRGEHYRYPGLNNLQVKALEEYQEEYAKFNIKAQQYFGAMDALNVNPFDTNSVLLDPARISTPNDILNGIIKLIHKNTIGDYRAAENLTKAYDFVLASGIGDYPMGAESYAGEMFSLTREAVRAKLYELGAYHVQPGMHHSSEKVDSTLALLAAEKNIRSSLHHGSFSAEIDKFGNTGVIYNPHHLIEFTPNYLARYFGTDFQAIKKYPGKFPGKFTRLEHVSTHHIQPQLLPNLALSFEKEKVAIYKKTIKDTFGDGMQQTGSLIPLIAAGALGAGLLFKSDKASAQSADIKERNSQMFNQTLRNLSEFIAGGESLNALDPYSAWAKPGAAGMIMKNMTSMKIGEVIEAAQGHAVGKYQNMPKYLKSRAKTAGFNIGTIFSPEVQEAIMVSTLMSLPQDNGLGLTSYLTGKVSQNTIINRIANMWRSMPGVGGMYVGGGMNPTGFDPSRKDLKIAGYLDMLKSTWPGFKKGGYVAGSPSTAIPAILHGGEYVINAKAVQQLGMSYLSAMNAATGSRFRAPSSRIGGPNAPVTQSVSNITIQVENFIGEEQWFNTMMDQYNVKVLPKNQKAAGLESRKFTSYNGINQGL